MIEEELTAAGTAAMGLRDIRFWALQSEMLNECQYILGMFGVILFAQAAWHVKYRVRFVERWKRDIFCFPLFSDKGEGVHNLVCVCVVVVLVLEGMCAVWACGENEIVWDLFELCQIMGFGLGKGGFIPEFSHGFTAACFLFQGTYGIPLMIQPM